jgi:hypothetical protein
MNVGMKRKILSPGMEYTDHSGVSTQMFLIARKTFHHTPCSIEEQFIHNSRLIQAEFVECFWQSEYYMKIRCWKQLRFSGLYPPLPLYLLALWAVPVPARVVADTNMATGCA